MQIHVKTIRRNPFNPGKPKLTLKISEMPKIYGDSKYSTKNTHFFNFNYPPKKKNV